MTRDIHGLPISTSEAAGAVFDRTVLAYLKYRADTADRLAQTLAADAEFGLAHCLKGYFAMLSYKQANVPTAAAAAQAARSLTVNATARERAHVGALEAWIAGDLDGALAVWEGILADHPTDIVALRLAHFNNFWLGRPHDMRASVERVLPGWHPELAGYGTVLSCRSFAHEECGDYATAEAAGRAAVEIDPGDVWGTHAVAHIMEMQGRHREGIDWLAALERHWAGGSNLLHHLWWHRALFHLEQRELDAVLELYDRRFRDLSAPLTVAQPDLYIDVQNAASMLFRLELHGVDVGERWNELADKAEARIGDCLSAFTLPHWMMALAATGRERAAQRMLEGMRECGRGDATVARVVGRVALPVCEAVLAHRRGEFSRATDLMRPVLDTMPMLGGSHAQQDVLNQLFLDSALRAGREHDAASMLTRLATHYALPAGRRIGHAHAAARVAH